ncbi:MAG: dockerin type I repeat-containing protein [Ruminococcus sp.]|nr:dockerin type I repeat-containing protein [Ruminococcus sp.]
MKKTKQTLLTAAAFAAAMNMSAAGNVNAVTLSEAELPASLANYDPSADEIQDVYGPAPNYNDDPVTTETLMTQTVPITTEIQTTYGPPIWRWDDTSTTSIDTTTTTSTTTVPVPLYGPMPAYTTTTTEPLAQLVYGPPQIFYQKGDINGDEVVDSLDMVSFRKYLLDEETPEWLRYVMDINQDGDFNVGDLVALQNYLLGRNKDFFSGIPQPVYGPPDDFPQTEYGPMPDYDEGQDTEQLSATTNTTMPANGKNNKTKTTTTTSEPVIEVPVSSLDPEDMPVQLMYGPPEYFGLDPETFQPKE